MNEIILLRAELFAAAEEWKRAAASADGSGDTEAWMLCLRAAGQLNEVAARLSGMAVVPAWQPIETAPRDGTRVFLYQPRGQWCGSRGNQEDVLVGYWHQPGNPERAGYWCASVAAVYRPTHWMPKPAAPEVPGHG